MIYDIFIRCNISSCRAVLLYNKHGILLEAFEREFKRLSGRGIPYKFLGYDSLYDLMSNSPDVVKVIQAAGGNILLVGVPDEKTIHVAKLVGNQRDSREGFNRKTADFVARLDPGTRMTLSTLTGHKDRQVSDFVKGQISQLLAMDLYLNGICLSDLPRAYDREFGYKIDCYQFGFTSIEDFVINGLKDVVDVDCDMFDMKIVEKGVLGITNFNKERREIPCKVVEDIKPLMSIEEDGGDGGLNVFQVAKEPQESQTSSDILSLVAGNVARLLEGHKEGVSLEVLLRGYEGWHGSWTDILTELKLEKVEELLELCSHVCKLQRGTAGQVTVVPTTAEPPRSVPAEISANLQQMVGNFPGGVEIRQIAELYQESYGQVLSPASLGFDSLAEIVQSAGASLVTEGDRVRCLEMRSARQVERLEAGWATVLSYSQHVMTCQQRRTRLQLTELEERMEQFYSSGSGRSVRPGTVMIGEMVAVMASDLAWRRGRVTRTDSDWLEVEQVDWGGLVSLRPEAVRYLEPRYCVIGVSDIQIIIFSLKVPDTELAGGESEVPGGEAGGCRGRLGEVGEGGPS